MTWQSDFRYTRYWGMDVGTSRDSLPINEQCFIRKDHKCGKLFGASKSCFIACPTDDELEPALALMSEKLSKGGIEPIIAVKERAYGQDIFCTKICGKIIESRFCIVILDDTKKENSSFPNPNVYYEYGLMTSLRKHIIPLQKEGLELAFNIQSYDTIKYSSRNIAAELDRAIKDAIQITEAAPKEGRRASVSEKTILRKLELGGLTLRNDEWILSGAIADTNLKGFGHYQKDFYLYLGKIDEESEFKDYLEDLGVVLYRTEKKAEELKIRIVDNEKRKAELVEQSKRMQETSALPSRISMISQEVRKIDSMILDAKEKLLLMELFYVGFIIAPTIKAEDFISKANELLKQYPRFKLSISSNDAISFGDVEVAFGVAS